ncbi:hypothetical protein [Micromonospora lupini]|uniref:Uncharacterized protein n=1 Tax=Micromonospora lupini str. Lupac 08 TaxID=1150864 RepID=I0L1N9_9ACTN|nr:hypothetical protein [Micromonospora lupini]CCH17736.1 hypothetical protein MILUP08_42667 [Micromonospora lupini str. Lupac 08]
MTDIVCSRCQTLSRLRRHGLRWCEACETYLVIDAGTGRWVSFADREQRRRAAEEDRAIARSVELVDEHLPEAQRLVPEGWAARRHQNDGARCHVAIDAPADVNATSYLSPPDGKSGWYVRVHNRTTGIDFPLYTDGGARAASFDTIEAAVAAAVEALRVESAEARPR